MTAVLSKIGASYDGKQKPWRIVLLKGAVIAREAQFDTYEEFTTALTALRESNFECSNTMRLAIVTPATLAKAMFPDLL